MNMSYSNISKELQDHVYKLTLAVLRTTDLFSCDEVLKKHISDRALDIFVRLFEYQHMDVYNKEKAISVIGKIGAIKGLFEIVRERKLTNEVNTAVLIRGYDTLISMCDGQDNRDRQVYDKIIPEEIKDTKKKDLDENSNKKPNQAQISRKSEDVKNQAQKTQKPYLAENLDALTDRQNMILSHIKQINQAKISDFYSMFGNISSKTIQRDLQNLVSRNLLKKEGEKRWTTYSLIDVQ